MLRLFAVLLFAALPASAFAGCYNYEEHPEATPPKVVICYEGECSETTETYTCGNAYGVRFGYKNGWKFATDIDGDANRVWAQTPQGVELDSFSGITCFPSPTNPDACAGLPPSQSSQMPTPPEPNLAEITRRLDRYIYPKDDPDTPSLFERQDPLPLPARIPYPVSRPLD